MGENERNLKHRVTTFLDHNFQTYYMLHKIKNILLNFDVKNWFHDSF